MKFRSGKYAGQAVANVPGWYLGWALQNLSLDPDLEQEIRRVLKQRADFKERGSSGKKAPSPSRSKQEYATGQTGESLD